MIIKLNSSLSPFCLILLLSFYIYPQQRSAVSGDLRFHELTSKVFGNTRTLRVLVPPGYEKHPGKEYPVLYLNDGQNLFDTATSLFNPMEWRVDETVRELIEQKKVEQLIVVGIDNAGKRMRPNEYLPFEDEFLRPPMPDPNGAKYPDFLTREVMPFIEKRYRIKKGGENTGLGGSSYGALIALYTSVKKPGVFGRLLLESPSFYVSDARILEVSRKMNKPRGKIYIGVGTNEDGREDCRPGDYSQEAVRDVLKLKKILQEKNIKPENLKVFIEDCAVHNEKVWSRRLPEALMFLYGYN